MNPHLLSIHLFWDVDVNQLTWDDDKVFIVQRVLDYGVIDDWNYLRKHISISEIGKIATQIKHLDKKSLSFIATKAGIPLNKFACYTTKPSTNLHWNF